MPDEPRRILIVKPTALGDVVQSLPVAGLLKRRWPEATIDWLIARPFAPLLETHPHVDDVLLFDRHRDAGPRVQARATRRLVAQLRSRGYDLAIDLQGLFRSGWLTRRSRARRRVGFAYAREGASLFYNDRVARRPGARNAAERYLDVAEHLGCGRSPASADIVTTDADDAAAAKLIEPLDDRPFVLMLPGTNWRTKRWPAEHFARLSEVLGMKHGLECVVAGAGDAVDAATLIGGLNVVNRTSVRELASLMKHASLVIANDSGPMHLAAALHRPLVALFGPTDPHLTGPHGSARSVVRLDVSCAPCFSRSCVHRTCLVGLSVEACARRCADVLELERA
ncbi:MAG: lipopolysaccharide heptosyltransferase II [Planctomycetota bacterium]